MAFIGGGGGNPDWNSALVKFQKDQRKKTVRKLLYLNKVSDQKEVDYNFQKLIEIQSILIKFRKMKIVF